MTYEEAISILTKDRALCLFNPLTGDGGPLNEDCRMSAEAMNLAIEALEKQIPKKPIIRKTEDYFGYVKYILCPSCEKVEFGFNQPCFCERCGQAIDWGEEE